MSSEDSFFVSDFMHLISFVDDSTNEYKLTCVKRNKVFRVSEQVWNFCYGILRDFHCKFDFKQAYEISEMTEQNIEQCLDLLVKNEFIFERYEEKVLKGYSLQKIDSALSEKWKSSLSYHLRTRNYPFVSYARGSSGPMEIMERMFAYSSAESDNLRHKSYESHAMEISLPNVFGLLEMSDHDTPSEGQRLEQPVGANCESELPTAFLQALSFAFGKTDEAYVPWSDTPLFRRTSPSGGSRHPIEGYFIDFTHNRLWHIDVAFHRCRLIVSDLFDGFISDVNSDAFSGSNGNRYLVVLTAVFERNMFRYREPRTFRSVHMDAGHLAATLQAALEIKGFQTHLDASPRSVELSKILGLDAFEEGVMLTVGVR